jgi:putative holliday junction resolvase
LRYLGVDLGTKRIGLALSDPDGAIALPLRVLERKGGKADLKEIAGIADEYEVGEIVVGLPINLRGEHGPAAQEALKQVEALRRLSGLPVALCDERMTTAVADRGMRAGGLDGRQRRAVVDKVAATVLLQSYLDHRRREHGSTTQA